MSVFSGNTTTGAGSTPNNIPAKILSFSLANKTGGSINVSVSILFGSTNVFIYSGSIAANASYTDAAERILQTGHTIYVLTTGSVDYFFSLSGLRE